MQVPTVTAEWSRRFQEAYEQARKDLGGPGALMLWGNSTKIKDRVDFSWERLARFEIMVRNAGRF